MTATPLRRFHARCCSPPVHVHGTATEFLTVRNGELGYLANGTEHTVKASDGSVRIEPGVPHTYWNAVRAAPEQSDPSAVAQVSRYQRTQLQRAPRSSMQHDLHAGCCACCASCSTSTFLCCCASTLLSDARVLSSQAPDTTLDFIATFSPPGNAEQFFRTVAGLGHDYGDYGKVGL